MSKISDYLCDICVVIVEPPFQTVTDKKCTTNYKKECKTVNEKVCTGYNQYNKQPNCHYLPR